MNREIMNQEIINHEIMNQETISHEVHNQDTTSRGTIPSNTTSKKSKIAKIIFLGSFIPLLLSIGYIAYSAIFGIEFFTMCYGIEGIEIAAIVILVVNVFCPILPICFIYQVIYILRTKCGILKNVSIPIIVIAVILGLAMLYLVGFFIWAKIL